MAFLLYESLRECIVQVKVTKTRSHFRRGENSLSCSDWLYNCVQLDMNLWNLIFYIQSHFVVYNFCENDNSLPSSKDIIEIFIEIQLSDIMLDICCHLAIKLHEYQSAGRKGTHSDFSMPFEAYVNIFQYEQDTTWSLYIWKLGLWCDFDLPLWMDRK